jgi:hypothetical protein
MRRRLPLPALLLLGGVLLMGCSDDEPAADSTSSSSSTSSASSSASSDASSGSPAVCASLDQLQTSVGALARAPLAEGGIDALRTAFTTVQADAAQVVDDARAEYADQSDQLSTDVSAVQSALGTAAGDPSAATLKAVGGAISTLASDVTSFAGDVASTC